MSFATDRVGEAMSDSIGTGLLVVLIVLVAVGVVLTAAVVFVIVRYRPPLRGIAAALAGLVYVLSPVDAVPEVPLGPVGLIDDIAVIAGTMMYVLRLLDSRAEKAALPPATGRGRRRNGRPARP
jgi:uncharacterized membrane protein YkvA (DUF1232 family)